MVASAPKVKCEVNSQCAGKGRLSAQSIISIRASGTEGYQSPTQLRSRPQPTVHARPQLGDSPAAPSAPGLCLPELLHHLYATRLPNQHADEPCSYIHHLLACVDDVCPSGCSHSTIASAIAAAADGDTVYLAAAIYNNEPAVQLSKSITIRLNFAACFRQLIDLITLILA